MITIKQGDDLEVSGVLQDDNDVVITDFATRKLSVALIDYNETIVKSWSTGNTATDVLSVGIDGVINFSLKNSITITMLGSYILEFKLTDNAVMIGKNVAQIVVENSVIGKEGAL